MDPRETSDQAVPGPGTLRDELARDALDAAGVGVWDWDADRGRFVWDEHTARLHGIDPGAFDGRMSTFMSRVHPDDRPSLEAAVQSALATGGLFMTEFRVVDDDGTVRWVQARGAASTVDGRRRILGIGFDTTELVQPRVRAARALEHVSDGLIVLDRNWRITFANATAASLIGATKEDLVGANLWERFPQAVGTVYWDRYHEAVATQQEQRFESFYGPIYGWFEIRALPTLDGLTLYFRNIDDERAAHFEREQLVAQQNHRLHLAAALQELTSALAQALTVEEIDRAVLAHCTQAVGAQHAGIALLDDAASTLTFVGRGGLPRWLREGWGVVPMTVTAPITETARTHRPVYYGSREAILDAYPGLEPLLDRTNTAASATLPVRGLRRVLGVLSMSWTQPRYFDGDDRRFLATVAAQAGQAIERARLYERQRSVADALQQAVLPEALPAPPGLELAARYQPAPLEVSVHVGGDWYDAFELPDGRLGVAVGDVSGHGVGPAAVMGTMRNALRAYAFEGRDPSEVMESLDRLLAATTSAMLVTCFYGVLDGEHLVWCRAGHVPAGLVDAGGHAQLLAELSGPLLGLGASAYRRSVTPLGPGDTLVLYTDGLIEHRSWNLDDALAAFVDLLAANATTPVETLCDVLVRNARGGRPQEDDACVLVLRRTAT